MNDLTDRLREPSTWAAIAALGVALGVNMPDDLWQNIVMVGSGLAGIVGIVRRERGRR